jgi:hypothetical protein
MSYAVLIGMAVLRAARVFGSVTVRRPFLKVAVTLLLAQIEPRRPLSHGE